MKIAQVAPLYESVPPKYYGGTERVVSYLTDELVRQGHAVTLFASGDSVTRAALAAMCPKSLRLDSSCIDSLAHHVLMLEEVARRSAEFDVIHYHIDYLHYPLSRRSSTPHVTTLHGRLDIPDLQPIYRRFGDMPVVSISNEQRRPLSGANWQQTVYHGLPVDLYNFVPEKGQYLAFLGRISREKGLDNAIEIARRAGLSLRIAAKVDAVDRKYFERDIQPLLRQPHTEYLGEIGDDSKQRFLGDAVALLFPVEWPEPFGLVMVEALACGTPVIAYRRGSVPEIVEDGTTGFIVNRLADAVRAVEQIDGISRERCRRSFEERFSAPRMARDYLSVYRRLLARSDRNAAAAGVVDDRRNRSRRQILRSRDI